jgi:hypothetical protein
MVGSARGLISAGATTITAPSGEQRRAIGRRDGELVVWDVDLRDSPPKTRANVRHSATYSNL